MAKIKKAINVGLFGMRKWYGSPRVLLIAVFMILSIYHMTGAISQFSADVNIKTAPRVFPFLSSDFYMQTVTMIGVVFLFCGAPFMDESAPYVIVGLGRFTWASGQMIYIFVASLIYILFLVITSIVCVLIDTLELIGLDFASKKHCGRYSLGIRKRLEIEQAIMKDSPILLLDDPTNGLDNDGVEDMRKLFMRIRKVEKQYFFQSIAVKISICYVTLSMRWVKELHNK